MAWMQHMYKKFEAKCLELDDILEQEGLKYVDQLQTVGANVKQFYSDFVQDLLLEQSEDTLDGVASDSCLVKNTEADKMSKEGIVQDYCDMEPCDVSHLLYSCSAKHIKATKYDLSLEEMVVAEIYEKSVPSIKENRSEEKQVQLETLDIPEENDLSVSVLSSTSYDLLESNSFTEVIPIDGPSSKSVNLVDSHESKIPELGFTSSDASAESMRQLNNSTEDAANLESSCTAKLDGSCFIIDCNEPSSVSYGAGQLRSSKETLDNFSFTKRRAVNQGPARYSNLDPESNQQTEGFASSVISAPDNELCDSDWVIV